ncbi:MAG: hypothetical protein ACYTFM_00195 [Planctomycetota bacterium]|jgi:hypothetical protein
MRKISFLLLLFFSLVCFAGTKPVKARKTKVTRPLQPPRRATYSNVTVDTPFEEAIDILRNSTDPPLQIVVMWRDLENNADVYANTPVGINGILGVKRGTALDIILLSISAQAFTEVDYVVKEGIIVVGTEATIGKKKMVTRVYDISHLTSPAFGYWPVFPSFGMGGFGGMGGGFGQGGFGSANSLGGMSGSNIRR